MCKGKISVANDGREVRPEELGERIQHLYPAGSSLIGLSSLMDKFAPDGSPSLNMTVVLVDVRHPFHIHRCFIISFQEVPYCATRDNVSRK